MAMVYQYGCGYRLNRARHHLLDEQTLALNDMQEHFKHIERIGIARGVMLSSQQGGQAILMKDSCGSDSEVSNDSDEETSDDLKVPHAGDLEILVQSDSSGQ